MSRASKSISLEEINRTFKEKFNTATLSPTIYNYTPHEKQIQFHSSTKKGRLYIGGNRSGKTVGGVVEDIWMMKGEHPYQKVPPAPTRGRIVTVSYTEGVQQIIIPELKRWLPPSLLINGSWEDSYNNTSRLLTLSNGSTTELMSYDQKLEKFAGTSRHWLHCDEEPPKDIFDECRMRLLDTGGKWHITMTPVEGMTWVYDDLYLPGLKADSKITVIVISTEENPYVTQEQIDEVMSGMDEKELQVRKQGQFVQIGNLAFKEFRPENVIEPYIPDPSWAHYQSMDHGLNAPTAWLWHAVSPKGVVITYDELYDSGKLINYYAEEIHKRNATLGRRPPDFSIGDPAIRQRNAQTGDSIQTAYARLGVPIVLGNNEVYIGVDKMNTYLKAKYWYITANCVNLIRELQRCRWKIYQTAKMRRDNNPREELHPQYDHAPDSCRYFFGLLPEMYIPPVGDPVLKHINQVNQSAQEIMGYRSSYLEPTSNRFDKNFWLPDSSKTEWTQQDEHLGGVW